MGEVGEEEAMTFQTSTMSVAACKVMKISKSNAAFSRVLLLTTKEITAELQPSNC